MTQNADQVHDAPGGPPAEEKLERLLEDPEFVEKLDDVKRVKAVWQRRAKNDLGEWTLWGKAILLAAICILIGELWRASMIHRTPLQPGTSDVLSRIEILHGSSLWETFLLRMLRTSTVITWIFLIPASWLYLQSNRKLSIVSFWLLIPLVLAPGFFMVPSDISYVLAQPDDPGSTYVKAAVVDSVLIRFQYAAFVCAVAFLAGKLLNALWPQRKADTPSS